MIRRLTVSAVAAFALTAPSPAPAHAAAEPAPKVREDLMDVTGEGRVPVKPDIMYVRAGVELRAEKAGDVYKATADAAAKLVKTITDSGVAAKDVRTAELSVQPEYGDKEPRKIIGYRGTERVNAVIRDLGKAHVTLNAIMGAGDDVQLDSVTFDKDDWSKEMNQAEELAIADAKRRAERQARLIGRKLGRAVKVGLSTVDPIPSHFIPKAAIAEAGGHLSPGEGVARVTAQVTYALK